MAVNIFCVVPTSLTHTKEDLQQVSNMADELFGCDEDALERLDATGVLDEGLHWEWCDLLKAPGGCVFSFEEILAWDDSSRPYGLIIPAVNVEGSLPAVLRYWGVDELPSTWRNMVAACNKEGFSVVVLKARL